MSLPLYFRFSHTVQADSFKAAVTARGRCLLYQDDDGWWLTGVECGGITADGADPNGVNRAFSSAFRETIDELVAGCNSLETFRVSVEQFFFDLNNDALAEWLTSRRELKSSALPDLSAVAGIPKVSEELPLEIVVQQVQATAPLSNDSLKVAA